MGKVCRTCGEMKNIEEYANSTNYKSGKSNRCRACEKEYRDAWKAKNPRFVVGCYDQAEKLLSDLVAEYAKHLGVEPSWDLIKAAKEWKRPQLRPERKPVTEKMCRKCGVVKGLIDLVANPNIKCGHSNLCKLCDNQRSREYYRRNKAKRDAWRKANKERLAAYQRAYQVKYRKRKKIV